MKILLGMTGSVATTLATKIVKAFTDKGHEVQVILTEKATYFLPDNFNKEHLGKNIMVWDEEDDFPEYAYEKGQEVPHVELGKWADVFVVAPCSANTLAKMANGICDNLLTCTYRALPPSVPVILAPAMNTNMWNHPVTQRNLDALPRCCLIEPVAKRLACGDEGIGALAPIEWIVEGVETKWEWQQETNAQKERNAKIPPKATLPNLKDQWARSCPYHTTNCCAAWGVVNAALQQGSPAKILDALMAEKAFKCPPHPFGSGKSTACGEMRETLRQWTLVAGGDEQ